MHKQALLKKSKINSFQSKANIEGYGQSILK